MLKGRLVLVGGASGAGKTALVQELLRRFPDQYTRPRSFTTRDRRTGEEGEYEFVDRATLLEMQCQGLLLNVDEVYGNVYAMDSNSVRSTIQLGMHAIKEIHPANHARIGALVPAVSVLVTGNGRPADRERVSQDRAYYQNPSVARSADIIVNIPPGETLADAACEFAATLSAWVSEGDKVPHPGQIDEVNAGGYALIAPEFDDTRRITTANFHAVSSEFFRLHAPQSFDAKECLEIGPGGGWLRSTIGRVNDDVRFTAVDLVPGFRTPLPPLLSTVRSLPFRSNSFDWLGASLADPYLYPTAICEMRRVLRPGGVLVLSAPTREWSEAVRPAAARSMTEFVLASGARAGVYSFTHTLRDLTGLLAACGLTVVRGVTETGRLLGDCPVSPVVEEASTALGVSVTELPLINLVVAEKRKPAC